MALSSFAAKKRPGLHDCELVHHSGGEVEASRMLSIPCMFTVPKSEVLDGSVHELMLCAFAIFFTFVGEAEGVEFRSVFINRLVEVHGVRRSTEARAFRDESPVRESKILQCFASYGGCADDNELAQITSNSQHGH